MKMSQTSLTTLKPVFCPNAQKDEKDYYKWVCKKSNWLFNFHCTLENQSDCPCEEENF